MDSPSNLLIMKQFRKTIFRILALPFIICLTLITTVYNLVRYWVNFIRFGGEVVVYTKRVQEKTIGDIVEAIDRVVKVEIPSVK